jgi:hypothetical protein
MPDGSHGFVDESDNVVGPAIGVLALTESLEKPVVFGHAKQGIVDAEL